MATSMDENEGRGMNWLEVHDYREGNVHAFYPEEGM